MTDDIDSFIQEQKAKIAQERNSQGRPNDAVIIFNYQYIICIYTVYMYVYFV